MVSEERLKNWAWYCAWGHVGPEVRTTAASAEGNYESEDVLSGQKTSRKIPQNLKSTFYNVSVPPTTYRGAKTPDVGGQARK